MPTQEQEREYVAQLEERSVGLVKRQLDQGEIPPTFVFVAAKWVSDKEREAEAEQMVMARSASDAATRAATAAERQATAAERANTRATIALTIAILSMIVSAIGIWLPYWAAHK